MTPLLTTDAIVGDTRERRLAPLEAEREAAEPDPLIEHLVGGLRAAMGSRARGLDR